MKEIWWKEAVGYQIYPRSFMDSNEDGIGDLRGIINKLDYLKYLGIDVIWICPMYKSPNDDNGYDISDYQSVLKDYGTMDDFDELLNEVHKRDMKLIIDLVINHTSDEHEWFIESKSSKDNPKRDWYIWRKEKEGEVPNNWESIFRGSAWEYDEKTEEYFLHIFSTKQPDLNWENEEVRKSLYEMINWWLDKGIDGFRVDAISHIKKEEGLLDMENPKKLDYVPAFDKMMNVEGIQTFLKELKEETFDKYDIMTVGEANGVTEEDCLEWVGEEEGKFNMIFHFGHMALWDYNRNKSFDILKYKKEMQKWQDALHSKGWNALFIENHDVVRVVSNWGDVDRYWKESAKSLGLSYFLQQGTPFIYQGQELGMTNIVLGSINDYDDTGTKNKYNEDINKNIPQEEALKRANLSSRDNSRTPMQWNDSSNAGFTNGDKTWFRVNPNYKNINVENQREDENSILNFYREMIKLRKNNKVLLYGKCNLLMGDSDKVYAYERVLDKEKMIILCNLTSEEILYSEDDELKYENMMLSNYKVNTHENLKSITLRPWECRVYRGEKLC